MAKSKDIMTMKDLADGIVRVMRNQTDDKIALTMSVKLCRDYPEVFIHLPFDLRQTILNAMEEELALFQKATQSPK
jgi:hypothetical protein